MNPKIANVKTARNRALGEGQCTSAGVTHTHTHKRRRALGKGKTISADVNTRHRAPGVGETVGMYATTHPSACPLIRTNDDDGDGDDGDDDDTPLKTGVRYPHP